MSVYGTGSPHKRQSAALTDGVDRAPARAMLKGVGFTDADLAKPLIGVATTWIETMPCNLNQRLLARYVKQGVRAAGGTPVEFNTVSVSDGVSMGTTGMRASLVSREVIADSIELVARGHLLDGLVCLVGCDKTIPAAVMALARLDIPGLVQTVVEGASEQLGVLLRDRRAQQRGGRGGRGRVLVRDGRRERRARAVRAGALGRHDEHRRQRQVACEPPRLDFAAAVPGDRDAAEQRRGEIVAVPLERLARAEELLLGRQLARRGGARDEAERDRARARAEPALERDAVHEPEPVARRR